MPFPNVIMIDEDNVIPIKRWSRLRNVFYPYSVNDKEKITYYKNTENLPDNIEVRYFAVMAPVFPLDFITPAFLPYSYVNMYRIDKENGEQVGAAIPLSEAQTYQAYGDTVAGQTSQNGFATDMAIRAIQDEAKQWGLDDNRLKLYPEIQSRIEDWGKALANGDDTDDNGMPVPPADEFANVAHRIMSYIPPTNAYSALLQDRNTIAKTGAVREAWAQALQNGVMDNQSQYTIAFSNILFDNLLSREDMSAEKFQQVFKLVETPEGFNNFMQTVDNAGKRAAEQGLTPNATFQSTKELVSRNILERLGLEETSSASMLSQGNYGTTQSPTTKQSPTMPTTGTTMQERVEGNVYPVSAMGSLMRAIDRATAMGIDTAAERAMINENLVNDERLGPAAGVLEAEMREIQASFASSQSTWLAQQFPGLFSSWNQAVTQKLGVASPMHPRYKDAFLDAMLYDPKTAPIDSDSGEPMTNSYYVPSLNASEVIKNALGTTAFKWLQEGRQNITSPAFSVPGAVTQDIERTTEYNKLKAEADLQNQQARNRPGKVARI